MPQMSGKDSGDSSTTRLRISSMVAISGAALTNSAFGTGTRGECALGEQEDARQQSIETGRTQRSPSSAFASGSCFYRDV
jgi:hypothetical protein